MGQFNDAEPYGTYYFSICLENTICINYFSEKVVTPLMYNCMPIYLGCKNLNNYLENVVILNGDINTDILVIMKIVENPYMYYIKMYTDKNIKAVNLIENLPNIFP